MKITNKEQLEFKVLQLTSNHFLCKSIPDNWYDLSEDQQNEFLIENNWEPFENYEPQYVWSYIENAAQATQEFIEDLNKEGN